MSDSLQTLQTLFDAAYWAHQHPELAALPAIADFDARVTAAVGLATKGFIVDKEIMVYGWDPFLVMKFRASYGYTWVPSLLQPPPAEAPGVNQPGTTPYDPNSPPPGSIKVSTDIADYPPLVPPPPPPAPVTVLVGGPQFYDAVGQTYYGVAGDNSPDGTTYTDDPAAPPPTNRARGSFLKHVVLYGAFRSVYWVRTA